MKEEQASDSSVGFTGNQFEVVRSHKGRLQRDITFQKTPLNSISQSVCVNSLRHEKSHCAMLIMNNAFRFLRLLCLNVGKRKSTHEIEIHQ